MFFCLKNIGKTGLIIIFSNHLTNKAIVMNRQQFIRSAKSALIFIPIAGFFSFDKISKIESTSVEPKSDDFFPDKDNYLVQATCLFKTPGWGDGKNGDDSFVDAFVDIECYDNLYSAQGGFGNKTEIETNVIAEMPIAFSGVDAKKIFYDGVKNINILILGHKPNQDLNVNDKWNIRWEFLMKFKKGNILATGYNDPAIEYNFKKEQTAINSPVSIPGRKKYFKRNQLLDHRTIDSAN